MRTKRAKVLIILSISFLALAITEIAVTSRLTSKNRLEFESLRDGMTVEEASQVLERDLNKDLLDSMYSRIPVDIYLFKTEWWIVPRDGISLQFSCGRLSGKESRQVPLLETWQELLYQGKQLVGR